MLAGQSLECLLHRNKYHCIEKSYLSLNLRSMNLELIKYFLLYFPFFSVCYWDVLCRCACIIDCFEYFIENLKTWKWGQKHTLITNIVIQWNIQLVSHEGEFPLYQMVGVAEYLINTWLIKVGFLDCLSPGDVNGSETERVIEWERANEFWDVRDLWRLAYSWCVS